MRRFCLICLNCPDASRTFEIDENILLNSASFLYHVGSNRRCAHLYDFNRCLELILCNSFKNLTHIYGTQIGWDANKSDIPKTTFTDKSTLISMLFMSAFRGWLIKEYN